MTAVGGVSVTVIIDGEVFYTGQTDENGVVRIYSIPRNKDAEIQLRKNEYMPLFVVVNNRSSYFPSTLKITLIDKETGQTVYTETKPIQRGSEVQFNYKIGDYQTVAGSILLR
jgi:Cys-tRNA synthase (O-phospho-L-seryl-tRNA:Cys-tRNA synthase)